MVMECASGGGVGGVAPEYESELLRSTNESELQLYSSEYESEFRSWEYHGVVLSLLNPNLYALSPAPDLD